MLPDRLGFPITKFVGVELTDFSVDANGTRGMSECEKMPTFVDRKLDFRDRYFGLYVSRIGGRARRMGSNEEEYISKSVEPATSGFYGEEHITVVPNLLNDRRWSRDTGSLYSGGNKHQSCHLNVRRHDLAVTPRKRYPRTVGKKQTAMDGWVAQLLYRWAKSV